MNSGKWDNDWLHFTKKTRRGIYVLIVIFIIISILPRLYYNYFYFPKHFELEFKPILTEYKADKRKEKENPSSYTVPTTPFNPNTYSLDEWMTVGLTKEQAQTILNYLKTGAKFNVKSDLKKLYVMNEILYRTIEPMIDLPEKLREKMSPHKTNYKGKNQAKKHNTIEEKEPLKKPLFINLASKEELMQIKGIGSFFAEEIIKLRESYGGIITINQLLEIYNMNQGKLDTLAPFFKIDVQNVQKININIASESELRKHPLITSDMAKSIVFYRENYKQYEALDELLLSPFIDSETLKNLTPYLRIE